jgi:hypothetical protein
MNEYPNRESPSPPVEDAQLHLHAKCQLLDWEWASPDSAPALLTVSVCVREGAL